MDSSIIALFSSDGEKNLGRINIEELKIPACLCGIKGEISYANSYFAKLTAYDRSKLQKMNIFDLVHMDFRGMVNQVLSSYEECEFPSFECQLMSANKTIVPVMFASCKVILNNGETAFLLQCNDISDKKNRELEVAENDELYKTIFNASGEGVIILYNGKIKFVNTRFQQMTAFTDDELVERNFLDFIYRDDVALMRDNIAAADRWRIPVDKLRVRFINKFNETLFFELHLSSAKSDAVHKLIIIADDITYMIGQDLLERQFSENLKFLNDTAIDFIGMVTTDAIYRYIGEKLSYIFEDSIIFISSYHEQTKQLSIKFIWGVNSMVEKILSFFKIDLKHRLIDLPEETMGVLIKGKLTDFHGGVSELSFHTIPPLTGKMIEKALAVGKIFINGLSYASHLYGNVSIITRKTTKKSDTNLVETFLRQASAALHRITLESELDEEKNFHSKLVEISPFPLIKTDCAGMIIFVSKNIFTILGYTSEEMVGRKVYEFVDSEYYGMIGQHLAEIENTQPVSRTYLLRHKDDTKRFCEINADYMIDHGGVKRYIIGLNDITERVKYETELEAAKNKAEESDRLKTAFLSNMSHEIRTPMNGIIGFSDLLKNPTISKEERDQFVEIINYSSKQLLLLLEDIIDISRIESGEVSVDQETFNLNELILQIAEYFNECKSIGKYAGKEITFVTKLADEVNPVIISDKNKLRQIINNLVSNALKFTEKGTIEIGYRTDGANTLKIYVKDTGIGIAPEHHKIIFERFRQVDDTSTKKYAGSGLGLAITKSLVELLGGSIHVDSSLRSGSTFYFYLPLKQGVQISPETKLSPLPVKLVGQILVAEDDDYNFKFLEVFIRKMFNVPVLRAATGRECIDMFTHHDVALIFMDMNMPDIDGFEAARIIKKMERPSIIIAQTAYATTEERKKCFDAGCDDYISKPIDTEKAYELLKKYLT